jgi:hypothetical protein
LTDPARGPALGATGVNLFRRPSVQIAIAVDAAATVFSVALYLVTSNPLVFALVFLAGGWLAYTVVRANRAAQTAPTATPSNDQIIQ